MMMMMMMMCPVLMMMMMMMTMMMLDLEQHFFMEIMLGMKMKDSVCVECAAHKTASYEGRVVLGHPVTSGAWVEEGNYCP